MKKRLPMVSVVIVTKNRPHDLAECISSLVKQSARLDELVVIDNSTNTKTQRLYKKLKKTLHFPFRLYSEKVSNYPRVYNQGLRRAQGKWVAFIDDDCVAAADWYAAIKRSVRVHKDAHAILGFSGTYVPQNIFSLATQTFNVDWKEQWVKGERVINCEVLDNKNIVYRQDFLKKHRLRFDESRVEVLGGAAEDCDLGMQIQLHGGKAVYDRKVKVVHKDPQHWSYYWRKYFTSLAAYRSFVSESYEDAARARLLSSLNKKKPRRQRGSFRQRVLQVIKEHNLPFAASIQFVSLVYATVAVSYVLKWLFQFPSFEKWYINKV